MLIQLLELTHNHEPIECSWGVLKTKILQKMRGTSAEMLPHNLIDVWY